VSGYAEKVALPTRARPTASGSKRPPRARLAIVATAIYVIVTSAAPYLYGNAVAAVVVLALLVSLLGTPTIPRSAVIWTMAIAALGVFGTLYGTFNQNPGAVASVTVVILEPLALGLLFGTAATVEDWRKALNPIFDMAIAVVSVVGLLMIASPSTGWLPPTWITGETHVAVDLNGVVRTNYQGYGSLAFLAPYAVMRVLRPGGDRVWFRILIAGAALSGVLLSGRNIYYVGLPLAIAATYACVRWRRGHSGEPTFRPGAAVAAVATLAGGLMILAQVLAVDVAKFFGDVLKQITLIDESGTRVGQSEALIDGWLEAPLLGQGVGAVLRSVVRNAERPWIFEQTYEATLFQFGAFGFGVLALWVLWIIRRLARVAREETQSPHAAVLAGLFGALVASAVNPYVTRFDGMWMIFIPFGLASAAVATAWRSS
jgi:hypothetical protein